MQLETITFGEMQSGGVRGVLMRPFGLTELQPEVVFRSLALPGGTLSTARRILQSLTIRIVRPYTIREMPAWGKLSSLYDHRADWVWQDAPIKTIREKMYGNLMRLDLSRLSDRLNYFLGRWYDLPAQLLISKFVKPGDTVIDVGAHRGEFAIAAASAASPGGKVICFEPNPVSVRLLKGEIELNRTTNIAVHACGLSDQEDVLTLTVDRHIGHFGTVPHREGNETFSVQVQRADDMLTGERPSVIKIDVEGFEVKVLRGMTETIKRSRPVIVTEVDPKLLTSSGSSFTELKQLMTDLGYDGKMISLKRAGRVHEVSLGTLTGTETCDAIWLPIQS